MANVPYGKPATVSNNFTVRRVWFTGKTQAITAAARVPLTRTLTNLKTIADTVLAVGSVLCRDPWGFDKGIGIDYTQAVSGSLGLGNMHEQKVVVLEMGPVESPDPAVDGFGRWVTIVDQSEDVLILTLTGGTIGLTIGVTHMGAVTGSFALQPILAGTLGVFDVATLASIVGGLEVFTKNGCALPVDPALTANQLFNGTTAGVTAPRLVRMCFNGCYGVLRPNL